MTELSEICFTFLQKHEKRVGLKLPKIRKPATTNQANKHEKKLNEQSLREG